MELPLQAVQVKRVPIIALFLLLYFNLSVRSQGAGVAYVHVAAGASFTFAIQSNGTLWAWGDNAYGQLGDGTTTSRTAPVVVPPPANASAGSRWVRIIAHDNPTPVWGLRSDNSLWQWGANQLQPVQIALPLVLPSGATFTTLASSGAHALALYSDGSVFAWGSNAQGQLGTGNTAISSSTPALVATPTAASPGTYWVAIEAENNTSFGIRSDGTLWSWGGIGLQNYNPMGHAVLPTGCYTPELVPHPAGASAGSKWVGVDAGEKHTLGLRSDGALWAWGSNSNGALGQGNGLGGSNTPVPIPVPSGVAAGTHWKQISAGASASQAIMTDGTLWAWGNNFSGQLGINSNNPAELSPVQEYNQEVWSQVALGAQHAVALSKGRVYVAGNGSQGQLGLGNAPNRFYFLVRVVGLPLAAIGQSISNSAINIFPNPVKSGANITVEGISAANKVEIINSQGQTIAIASIVNAQVNIPKLAPGIYLIRIYEDSKSLGSRKLQVY